MPMKIVELQPIHESLVNTKPLERMILDAFKRLMFFKVLDALDLDTSIIKNARSNPLLDAIKSGKVSFSSGAFKGKFNAAITRQLKKMGAKWDKRTASFKIGVGLLDYETVSAIAASESALQKTLTKVDKALRQVSPVEIADAIDSSKFFDKALWEVDKKLADSVESVTVIPEFSDDDMARIAVEWRENLEKPIKIFADEQTKKLREQVQDFILQGGRRADLADMIKKSYNVTKSKAEFWAQQETNLLLSKFKEIRYQDAGIFEYRWMTVGDDKVRHSHKELNGKIFRFDSPPITSGPNEPERRNNPGEDFRCRCVARPIYRKMS